MCWCAVKKLLTDPFSIFKNFFIVSIVSICSSSCLAWLLPHCMECQCGQATRKLSVKHVICDERKLCPHSYTTWKIIYHTLVLWQEKWLVWGNAFYLHHMTCRLPHSQYRSAYQTVHQLTAVPALLVVHADVRVNWDNVSYLPTEW